jgi:hypothetical protein
MRLRNRFTGSRTAVRNIGLWSLVIGSLLRFALHPAGHFGRGVVDGTLGLFYGVAIGALLLSLRRTSEACGSETGQAEGSAIQ